MKIFFTTLFLLFSTVLFTGAIHAETVIIQPGETYITPPYTPRDSQISWGGYFGLVEESDDINPKNLKLTFQRQIDSEVWETLHQSQISRFVPLVPKKIIDHLLWREPTPEELESSHGYCFSKVVRNRYRCVLENPNSVAVACSINIEPIRPTTPAKIIKTKSLAPIRQEKKLESGPNVLRSGHEAATYILKSEKVKHDPYRYAKAAKFKCSSDTIPNDYPILYKPFIDITLQVKFNGAWKSLTGVRHFINEGEKEYTLKTQPIGAYLSDGAASGFAGNYRVVGNEKLRLLFTNTNRQDVNLNLEATRRYQP